ncbi:uncharacterized protein LOC131231610 isoform X2 [Magnolia sinica]|uniref:uncharacterized protein LOC131231610 isoform X2 n=1 Tax=Magnolia sinica TaxID=86752 RepID=UPI00265870C1|nr:uncharacterized protein LOC131231610 isoform X2 [Magnolia sinica]
MEMILCKKSGRLYAILSVGLKKKVPESKSYDFRVEDVIFKGRKEYFPLTLPLATKKKQVKIPVKVKGEESLQVVECHLVMDPRTRESRGFGFVTMETVQDADRCVKYLNRSVLEGRLITVQKVVGGDSRLASHPGGGKEAPLIRGVGGNDPALRMGGGMSIPTHTGDTGSVHCQLAAKDDTSHEALQSSQPTFSLAFLCITSDCGCGFTPKGMPFSFQTPNWIQTGILSTWVWTSMFEIACHVIATPKLAYESMFESIIFIACLVGID